MILIELSWFQKKTAIRKRHVSRGNFLVLLVCYVPCEQWFFQGERYAWPFAFPSSIRVNVTPTLKRQMTSLPLDLQELWRTQRSNNETATRTSKKITGLLSNPPTLHVHHTFLYISLPFLHDYDVKMPNFAFNEERKQSSLRSVASGLEKPQLVGYLLSPPR